MGKKIFEPFQIKSMALKNRIGFPPFLNMPRGEDGTVSDKTIRWFEQLAEGGAGLIMTGTLVVSSWFWDAIGKPYNMGLPIHDDQYLDGWKHLTDIIHAHGAKIGAQIGTLGPMLGLGPSVDPFPDEKHRKSSYFEIMDGYTVPVREITADEIEALTDDFAAAALRVKQAGFDCVELHCGHGGATLHCAFMSPFYNKRTDLYGGNWENRMRFPVETIKRMRRAVGDDYPILVRIVGDELLGSKGITLRDTTDIIVPELEVAGVDCFDVTQGSMSHSTQGIIIPMYYPRGCFIHLAEAVKKATHLPVIGVGRIIDPDMAEKYVEEGKADLIYMGRQLIADPDTVNKYAEGHPEDIRQCTGCVHTTGECGRPCAINYDRQDDPVPLVRADNPKNVLVIGGGVAGMEAARVAALRGHKVTLMEKSAQMGGIVAALAMDPLTAEFGNFVDYLIRQMKKLNIDVQIQKEATIDAVREIKPDAVILAAGSSQSIPDVAKGKPAVMTHIDALKRQREIGRRVVIWGLSGAEFAISLADMGKEVVLIGRRGEETLAKWDPPMRRFYLLRRLSDVNAVRETPETARLNNPEVLYYVTVDEVSANGVAISYKGGEKRILPYDTLIVSRERTCNDDLYEKLQRAVAEVHKIGDCLSVGDIQKAVWTANETARSL